jgi:hypothetical protein
VVAGFAYLAWYALGEPDQRRRYGGRCPSNDGWRSSVCIPAGDAAAAAGAGGRAQNSCRRSSGRRRAVEVSSAEVFAMAHHFISRDPRRVRRDAMRWATWMQQSSRSSRGRGDFDHGRGTVRHRPGSMTYVGMDAAAAGRRRPRGSSNHLPTDLPVRILKLYVTSSLSAVSRASWIKPTLLGPFAPKLTCSSAGLQRSDVLAPVHVAADGPRAPERVFVHFPDAKSISPPRDRSPFGVTDAGEQQRVLASVSVHTGPRWFEMARQTMFPSRAPFHAEQHGRSRQRRAIKARIRVLSRIVKRTPGIRYSSSGYHAG